MRIDDFGEYADGGKWTFRGENLTWGNCELKMGDHPSINMENNLYVDQQISNLSDNNSQS